MEHQAPATGKQTPVVEQHDNVHNKPLDPHIRPTTTTTTTTTTISENQKSPPNPIPAISSDKTHEIKERNERKSSGNVTPRQLQTHQDRFFQGEHAKRANDKVNGNDECSQSSRSFHWKCWLPGRRCKNDMGCVCCLHTCSFDCRPSCFEGRCWCLCDWLNHYSKK